MAGIQKVNMVKNMSLAEVFKNGWEVYTGYQIA